MTGPAVMTFATLKQDLQQYLERGDTANSDATFDEQLPRLIMLAEKQILQDLKILGFKEVVTGNLAAGTYTYAIPDRWRETISLTYTTVANARKPINQRDYTYLQLFEPDRSVQGAPRFYAYYDYSNVIVSPTPDAAYAFEWSYYAIPPLLSDDQQTNWITNYLPNLLLYGALVQAEAFLKDDTRLATWKAQYEERVQRLNIEDIRKIGDGSAIRRGA